MGVDHPKMIEKRWQKGQSGNPAGRPPRRTLEGVVLALMDKADTDDEARQILDKYADKIVDHITNNPDSKASMKIIDRMWPDIKKVEVSGVEDKPVEIAIDKGEQAEKAAKAIEILGDVIKPPAE